MHFWLRVYCYGQCIVASLFWKVHRINFKRELWRNPAAAPLGSHTHTRTHTHAHAASPRSSAATMSATSRRSRLSPDLPALHNARICEWVTAPSQRVNTNHGIYLLICAVLVCRMYQFNKKKKERKEKQRKKCINQNPKPCCWSDSSIEFPVELNRVNLTFNDKLPPHPKRKKKWKIFPNKFIQCAAAALQLNLERWEKQQWTSTFLFFFLLPSMKARQLLIQPPSH